MVRIGGVPFLEYQLRLLRNQGLTDVVILTGHLGEQIEQYFGRGSHLGLAIRYSREQVPLGTGGALRHAGSVLGDLFLVIYGDSYLPIDYPAVGNALAASPATGLVVVYDNRLGDTSVRNNIAVDPAGYVSRYDKAAREDPELLYVEAGVLAFRRSVLDLIPPGASVSLENQVFPLLIERHELIAYFTKQRFYDIGTLERLRVIERVLCS